ncbi:hypothetical protein C5748_26995 [Phyllobacterium phragmitis]|uniref:SANT/Myb domain-containing protein n=1 Tax=Phyllobacterium phragmitis TaxID=2670329 RepID=A0A2S9IIR9_9HYPH|nr:hypothetical protein [Phyllobacterium phragmitis]PRD40426.1 hypothetical protein C5748_26995 [Phyllobacterium phragmitis]
MYLNDYSHNARSADRAHRRIRYRGTTPKGDALWTPEEDELCRTYGVDYTVLIKKLPHRSYSALRGRCQKLGLRPQRNLVTASELSKMRRVVPNGTPEEIRQAFPHRTLGQIGNICRYHGIRRKQEPLKITGHAVLDAIRQRCAELNYSMRDLDELARTKRYFRQAGWLFKKRLNYQAIGRAVQALDGELTVRWRDQ